MSNVSQVMAARELVSQALLALGKVDKRRLRSKPEVKAALDKATDDLQAVRRDLSGVRYDLTPHMDFPDVAPFVAEDDA